MTDEREGKPSASNFDRYAACPGSWELSKQAPPQEEEQWTKDGTIVHDLLAGIDRPDATDEHREMAERCKAIEDEARATIGAPNDPEENREERWWDDLDLFSGKADLTVFWTAEHGNCVWIHDHKTGRNEVDPAPSNHQLRALVAACAKHETTAYVSVGGPFQEKRLTIAQYGRSDIKKAKLESIRIVESLTTHKRVRIPGDHCRYCPAKAICPELQSTALAASQSLATDLSAATKESIAEAAKNLPTGQLATLMRHYKAREWANAAIAAETKRRLTAGEHVEGWTLEEGSEVETITDVMGVYGRMKDWCTPEQFCKVTSLNKEALTNLVKESLFMKGKELKQTVKQLTEGFTVKRRNAPSLVQCDSPSLPETTG